MSSPKLLVQSILVHLCKERHTILHGLAAAPGPQNVTFIDNTWHREVWQRDWKDPVNPSYGTIPFALEANNRGESDQKFLIELKANFVFPTEWLQPDKGGTALFKMRLESKDGVKMESLPAPILPGAVQLEVKEFLMMTPKNGGLWGPFKADVDWTATVVCCLPTGDEAPALAASLNNIKDSKTIPLEAYFFIGEPHALFWKGHRLEIIRRSIMGVKEYLTITNSLDYRGAAVSHIAQDCWGNFAHLSYAVDSGSSSCGMCSKGGKLNLAKVFRDTVGVVNCYDLAGINQAWSASLGRINKGLTDWESPVLEHFWVFSGSWFGYVTSGPMFGWVHPSDPDPTYRQCNSPLWGLRDSKLRYYSPQIRETDPDRTYFEKHAWTEVVVQTGGQRRVLETCHAYLRGDDVENVGLWDGAASRGEWLVDAVDVGAETAASEKNFIPIAIDGNGWGVYYDASSNQWYKDKMKDIDRGLYGIIG